MGLLGTLSRANEDEKSSTNWSKLIHTLIKSKDFTMIIFRDLITKKYLARLMLTLE